jgi:RNA polymerase sigma-70 factor (ECF subfamily)
MEPPSPDRLLAQHERDERLTRLLAASAQGNAEAFEAFYKEAARHALAAVRKLAGESWREDILADTFLQAWRECARYEPHRGSPLGWIVTIARSRALDRLRQEALRHGGLDGAPEHDPDEDTAPSGDPMQVLQQLQERAQLHGLLDQLPARERWVLSLACFRDLSQSEIAAQTGMPLGTVKTLMNRAQQKLRASLGPAGAPEAGA